ncbi:Ribonuclease H-like domain,Transposase IS30-like HTH domain [Cinara cedri]|uniref:Ribonuclease H-like domain,Transposase IS30-like HTH domain n=1 Tax=Cinara cedri TaxID=506608 RepID=A0A5E4MFG2_9HEMI|nr:Ribonuclease H-like domain,Transposase IS30-like HTH domain [Cinara cedri]
MGRKKCETNKIERELILRLHNQCQSLRQISKIVNRARSTVKDAMDRYSERKSHVNKQRSGRPKKLSDHDKRQKRFAFARDNLHQSDNFWNKVIFTDESRFNIFGSDGKRFVWRKANTEMEPKNLQPTVKYGGGSTNFAASAETMGIKDDFIFTQDNDPKHTEKKVNAWLSNNVTEYLVTPPQYPDINPIENLWDYLDRKIRDHNISSKETLKKIFQVRKL